MGVGNLDTQRSFSWHIHPQAPGRREITAIVECPDLQLGISRPQPAPPARKPRACAKTRTGFDFLASREIDAGLLVFAGKIFIQHGMPDVTAVNVDNGCKLHQQPAQNLERWHDRLDVERYATNTSAGRPHSSRPLARALVELYSPLKGIAIGKGERADQSRVRTPQQAPVFHTFPSSSVCPAHPLPSHCQCSQYAFVHWPSVECSIQASQSHRVSLPLAGRSGRGSVAPCRAPLWFRGSAARHRHDRETLSDIRAKWA